ncbi:MAG: outer membrane lipid asymmetry maintenance protein MlaD [Pseudomonadota bacterium]
MNSSRAMEMGVGLFVIIGVAALLMLALQASNMATYTDDDGYEVIARFDNIGGLNVRAPVRVAGVRVGRVAAIDYDPESYQARVVLRMQQEYEFPMDTTASIYTNGLLGENYISMDPGGSFEMLREGDRIQITQSAMVLEQLIGRFLFDEGGGDSDGQ